MPIVGCLSTRRGDRQGRDPELRGEKKRREEDVREDDGGDVIVALLLVLELLGPEEAVRQLAGSRDSYRGQQSLARDVAERGNTRDAGLLVLVDNDVALLVQLDAELLQAEVLRVRVTADGPQQAVDLDLLPALEVHRERLALGALDLLHLGAVAEVDAGVLHPVRERLAEHGVERPEHGLAADEHRDLAAERVEDTGDLDRDVARADDRDALWLLGEVEEAVRVDAEARTGDLVFAGDGRATTGRDADVRGVERVLGAVGAGNLHRGRRRHACVAMVVLDLLFRDVVVIDAVQPPDVRVALGLEGGPVKLWGADARTLKVVALCVADLLRDVGRMPHNLTQDEVDEVDAVETRLYARTFLGTHPVRH